MQSIQGSRRRLFGQSQILGLIVAALFAGACGVVPGVAPAHADEPGVALVTGGEPQVAVVLPDEPEADEQKAADELVEHIELISGAQVAVVADSELPDGVTPIRLGGAADASLEQMVREEGDNPSAFALVVDEEDGISIRGLSAEGTLFGAYELLEQLGLRWYHPGDLGRVVPATDTLAVAPQQTVQVPSMDYRQLQHVMAGEWPARVRLGGEERSTGAHNIPPLDGGQRGRQIFERNPEYYGLVNGERRMKQICVSNPEVLDLVVDHLRTRLENNPDLKYVGMGPNDGGSYCQCEGCTALDQGVYDPLMDGESMTDRYIWFFNQVLERLEDDHPDLHLVWYVYAYHMMPPAIEPNPRIVGVFAPITLDRIRGMDNPMSPDRHIFRWIIDQWSATGPNEMYYRGYYNNLACPQFPMSQIDRIRHETPAFRELGINVMRVETIASSWSTQTPSIYLATRMMWDVETDVDALLEEFYELYYGPAREPMKQYHEMLEAAFRDTPYFTGSSYLYFPLFLDHPRRDEMRALLDEARVAAAEGEPIYADRVAALRLGWDRFDIFLDMTAARNALDFDTAFEKMDEFYRISDEMVGHVLEAEDVQENNVHRLLHWTERSDNPRGYFNRFFSHPVKSGYERAVEQGEIVAGLPDEWDFLIDPSEIGEIAGYHRPGELGGNWQPMLTTSRSWSDQGLHYYKGVAWYRTRVHIPAEYEGRPIYLWFGGVDDMAHVWINGEFVGTSREPSQGLPGAPGSFRPFDMPATEAVRFGEENWVAVKIENRYLAELGTGGILAPVMFWSPNDPAWQPGD